MKYVIYIIVICVITLSCKKDKLIDEKSVFVGKWEWVNTEHSYGWCDGDDFEEIITPTSSGNNYSMVFHEKGKVDFYESGTLTETHRMVFKTFNPTSHPNLFVVLLDNNDEDLSYQFSGYIFNDTIQLSRGFPFANFEEGCENYWTLFVKH
jgi:hypothetical protein